MFETGTLERGDSVNFESGTPHRLSNPYDEECVAICVVVTRQTQP
jgi:mannose-6-phosphate isomerase-like protein (cupin superfamily)